MINKKVKNALYTKVLMLSEELLNDPEIKEDGTKTLLCKRMKDNAGVSLIRRNKFYTDGNDTKFENIFININNIKFTLDGHSIKSLLNKDAEKILKENYLAKKFVNTIDINKVDEFDFHKYIEQDKELEENRKLEQEQKKLLKKQKEQKRQEELKKQEILKEKELKEKAEKAKQEKQKQIKQNINNQNQNKQNPQKQQNTQRPIKKSTPPVDYFDEIIIGDDLNTQLISDKKNHTVKNTYSDPIEKKPVEQKPIEAKKEVIQKEDEIPLIEDSIKIVDTTPPIWMENKNTNTITTEDLIMDTYMIKFEGEEKEEVFTIIVAPTEIPADGRTTFVPTFTFAKIGKHVNVAASPNKKRTSYQIVLEDEIFVIRGGWNEEGFYSTIYPQNTNNKKFSIINRKMRPSNFRNLGHNITILDNEIKIHVLPLSSKNGTNDKVGFLACLEDPKEAKYIVDTTKEKSYVDINYNEKIYRISASWNERQLLTSVQII